MGDIHRIRRVKNAQIHDSTAKNAAETEAAIKHLEEKYGIRFPEALRKLYAECETGRIKLCVFDIGGVVCEVCKLTHLKPDILHFEKIADWNRADGFLPDTFYPLAADRGGDTYYWDSASEKVYLSFPDDIEHPLLIANSTSEFIALLDKSVAEADK